MDLVNKDENDFEQKGEQAIDAEVLAKIDMETTTIQSVDNDASRKVNTKTQDDDTLNDDEMVQKKGKVDDFGNCKQSQHNSNLSSNQSDSSSVQEASSEVILVTGGAGFIGSHVACYLHNIRGPKATVVVFDSLEYCGVFKNLQAIASSPRFVFVKGNVCDETTLRAVFLKHKVTHVLHFAALSHVDNSFGSTMAFTKNNVVGTHVVMDLCREFKDQIEKIVHVSTDEVYGSTMKPAVEENTLLHPTNPYSASKAAAEMIVLSYLETFKLPIVISRGNNVYGSRQYPEKLIPKLIMRAVLGKSLPIHGSGHQLRSYIHVSDVVKAYNILLEKGVVGCVYNIGTHDEVSVTQVARDICAIVGCDPNQAIVHVEDRISQDQQYSMSTKAMCRLGWEAKMPWNEGLQDTVAWYKENMNYWGDIADALIPHTSLPTHS